MTGSDFLDALKNYAAVLFHFNKPSLDPLTEQAKAIAHSKLIEEAPKAAIRMRQKAWYDYHLTWAATPSEALLIPGAFLLMPSAPTNNLKTYQRRYIRHGLTPERIAAERALLVEAQEKQAKIEAHQAALAHNREVVAQRAWRKATRTAALAAQTAANRYRSGLAAT